MNELVGTDTTAAVLRMRVAVVGMNGLAAETCKNLLLLGVGEVKVSVVFYFSITSSLIPSIR